MYQIAGKTYEVVTDYRDGWKPDAFKERFSEVLERYDYIVGDWGYNQLRLRGFFKENHPKATKENSIASLQDYLNEYCNFGCPYFIIEKVPGKAGGGKEQAGASSGGSNSGREHEREQANANSGKKHVKEQAGAKEHVQEQASAKGSKQHVK